MTRAQALNTVQQVLLPQITKLYALRVDDLHLCPGHEGCQNVVFFYTRDAKDYVLRISYRPDRTPDQIHAEIDFIHYLHDHGVRVSRGVRSQQGQYVEVCSRWPEFVVVHLRKLPDTDCRIWGIGIAIKRRLTSTTTTGDASWVRCID